VEYAVTFFAIVLAWLAFNALVAVVLTDCAPGERLWRRQRSEPAGRSLRSREGETTILSVVKPTYTQGAKARAGTLTDANAGG
jgi:hypothetical protein